MYVKCQIFIIFAIIHSSYCGNVRFPNESGNCSCDVLEVESDWLDGIQKFTKQIGTLNGKPYYFSTKWNLISWKNGAPNYWSLDKYNSFSNVFESTATFTTLKMFSFDNMCENKKWTLTDEGGNKVTRSQCLEDTSDCPNTKKLTTSLKNGSHIQSVNLQAKYYDLCPPPEKADEADVVTSKSKYIVGILVGVFIIVAIIIIGYICIKKRKRVAHPNAHATEEFSLENTITGNQAGINSNQSKEL